MHLLTCCYWAAADVIDIVAAAAAAAVVAIVGVAAGNLVNPGCIDVPVVVGLHSCRFALLHLCTVTCLRCCVFAVLYVAPLCVVALVRDCA